MYTQTVRPVFKKKLAIKQHFFFNKNTNRKHMKREDHGPTSLECISV